MTVADTTRLALNRLAQIGFWVAECRPRAGVASRRAGAAASLAHPRPPLFRLRRVRLLPAKSHDAGKVAPGSRLCFICHDIAFATGGLAARDVKHDSQQYLIARMPRHESVDSCLENPDGHALALTREAPKGEMPPTD